MIVHLIYIGIHHSRVNADTSQTALNHAKVQLPRASNLNALNLARLEYSSAGGVHFPRSMMPGVPDLEDQPGKEGYHQSVVSLLPYSAIISSHAVTVSSMPA